jgi:endoglucanase
MKIIKFYIPILVLFICNSATNAQEFQLNSLGYFTNQGVNVMAYDDVYPEGHQGGIGIIMHGNRVATNGDLRLEATPGQWQAIPVQNERIVIENANTISVNLSYPDTSRHLKGFNPLIYPDFELAYTVNVQTEGASIILSVDLDRAIPESFIGKIGFNLELYPADLF